MNFIDGYYINLASHEEFTKDDIIIDYQPEESTIKFTYTIIKNGKRSEPFSIEGNNLVRIVLKETGQYKIEFTNYYSVDGLDYKTIMTGSYNIDKKAPIVEFTEDEVELRLGEDIDLTDYVVARDNVDGDISHLVEIDTNNADFKEIGKHSITYRVTDSADNTTYNTLIVNVVPYNKTQAILTQVTVIGIIAIVLLVILSYYRSIVLEKRISRFSISPKFKKSTIFERFIKVITGMIEPFADWLSKSALLERYANRYERYQVAFHEKSSMMIVAKKILSSIIFFALSLLVVTLKLEVMNFVEMILALLIGFYIIDFIYLFKYQFYRKNVENDLLQAIIVMKNAFKSGNSLIQSIEIVSEEVDSDIALEFRRMKLELSMGLTLNEVFERFAKRVDISEVSYLASSLVILNRTGGNIIKVFSSIEKTLMNKKKIRLELQALTASSRIVMYILTFLPIVFISLVALISPSYFKPFFDSALGILLLILALAIYLLYICIVKKIMKVKV